MKLFLLLFVLFCDVSCIMSLVASDRSRSAYGVRPSCHGNMQSQQPHSTSALTQHVHQVSVPRPIVEQQVSNSSNYPSTWVPSYGEQVIMPERYQSQGTHIVPVPHNPLPLPLVNLTTLIPCSTVLLAMIYLSIPEILPWLLHLLLPP